MNKRFTGFIEKGNPKHPLLPVIHSTSLYSFRDVLLKQQLGSSHCNIFNEPLLYLFYGRPSYRVASDVNIRTDIMYCPICLVLSQECISSIKRIYPFDTGAFAQGKYSSFLPKESALDSFFLGISPDIPQRVVDIFFGSNRNYYFGDVRKDLSGGVFDFEVNSYYQLISATGESGVDDRRYSIEIQTSKAIELTAENVLAVVIPKAGLEESEIFDAINNKWKAIPLTYNTYRGTSPSEYHGVIREQISHFLEDGGYL